MERTGLVGHSWLVDPTSGQVHPLAALAAGATALPPLLTCAEATLQFQRCPLRAVQALGEQATLRLTTALGHTIEATPATCFYTAEGYQPLASLQPGDLLAVPRRLPIAAQTVWPEHALTLLGFLLARSQLTRPSCLSLSLPAPYGSLVQELVAPFTPQRVRLRAGGRHSTLYISDPAPHQRSGLAQWLAELELLGRPAAHRIIPRAVFTLAPEALARVLAGLWELAGTWSNESAGQLWLSTPAPAVARWLPHLLLRLGIVSAWRPTRAAYRVQLSGETMQHTFATRLGPYFRREEGRQALALLVAHTAPGRLGLDRLPPILKPLVQAARARWGGPWTKLEAATGAAVDPFRPHLSLTRQALSRANVARLASYLDDAALRRYTESDLFWDQVASLEEGGVQPVYRLRGAGAAGLVANDILVQL